MASLTASIEIQNLDTLDDWLRQLPLDVSTTIMRDALGAGGEVIRSAAAANIHSRTGATAADLRVEVQVKDVAGAAAVGGTSQGTKGRNHVLRWLEFGTKAHVITPNRPSNRTIRRALSALDRAAAAALSRGLASGQIRRGKGALAWRGGRHPIKGVKHPATAPQSPLTRAIAEHGDECIKVFTDSLWSGIIASSRKSWSMAA